MDPLRGPCPHQSVPVEMDESMTASSLERAWPASCERCSGPPESSNTPQEQGYEQGRWSQQQHAPHPRCLPPTPPGHMKDVWPHAVREQDPRVNHRGVSVRPPNCPQELSLEEAESLEPPLPLMSDINPTHNAPSRHPAARTPGPNPVQGGYQRQCACCAPVHQPLHYPVDPPHPPHPPPQNQQSWNPRHDRLQPKGTPHAPVSHHVEPPREVMHEVSVTRSLQGAPGPATREIKKTISLSEECRTLFITYSVDVAEFMIPFATFLTDQGFKPKIDIFDDPIRRMDITKWMDRFLNDKSVIIIVVISPKYQEDVEGNGDDDEHGLHTKYIHNQLQNEFIQQRCLNFRLVPVLFPNATKRHVPRWLQSTRIYRWPQDTTDLLLRLLREERYVIPTRGADLTLTVRPL